MKREEAIKWLIRPTVSSTEIGEIKAKELEAYDMAIEALQAKTDGDLISRQDAIEAVRKVWYDNDEQKDFKQRYYEMGNNDAVEDAIGYIDALPSADRTEPGRWEIKQDTDEYGLKRPKLVCSKCEKEPAAWDLTELFDFCPNCGADMRGKKHE